MKKSFGQIILNIYGIFDIVFGLLVLVFAALVYFGIGDEAVSGVVTSTVERELSAKAIIIILVVMGLLLIIIGAIARAAYKDCRKATGIWILTMLAVISSAVTLFLSYRQIGGYEFSQLRSQTISLVINLILFISASSVRYQGRNQ